MAVLNLGGRLVTPPEHQPDRYAANWLLAATTLACALHAARLPPTILAAALALLGWRYMATNHGWRTPGLLVRLGLLGLAVAAVFGEYGGVLGRDPGVALLVALVCLKLLEIRRLRDYLVTATLLFFVTLAAFLYSQSPLLAGGAILVAWVTVVSLVYLSLPERMPLRRALSLTGGLLLRALPLVLLMYLLFPRVQGGLWGLPGDAYSGMTGLDDVVAPGTVNELAADDSVAFRVQFEGPRPANRDLYWRALVLRDTDGRVWMRGDAGARNQTLEPGRADGDRWRYSITLEPSGRRWLPALDWPVALPEQTVARPGRVLEHLRILRERIRYPLESASMVHAPSPLSDTERARVTRVPAATTARVRALADGWRQAAGGDLNEIVRLALQHFHQEPFRYTLLPPILEGDPIDEFLFETRAGFCEHFASAFAVLMRAAGIPARMVVGYLGGEEAIAGDYLILRQRDAHAWVELWLDDALGWQRVDPTGAVAPERVELGLEAIRRLELQGYLPGQLSESDLRNVLRLNWAERGWRSTRLSWDAMNTLWYDIVLDYDRQRQSDLLRRLGLPDPSPFVLSLLLLGTATLVLGAVSATMLRGRRRRDPLEETWQRFCSLLAGSGVPRRPSEGPRDYVARAADALPSAGAEIRAIGEGYIALCYGDGIAAGDPGRIENLRDRVRRLKTRRRLARGAVTDTTDSSSRSG